MNVSVISLVNVIGGKYAEIQRTHSPNHKYTIIHTHKTHNTNANLPKSFPLSNNKCEEEEILIRRCIDVVIFV